MGREEEGKRGAYAFVQISLDDGEGAGVLCVLHDEPICNDEFSLYLFLCSHLSSAKQHLKKAMQK